MRLLAPIEHEDHERNTGETWNPATELFAYRRSVVTLIVAALRDRLRFLVRWCAMGRVVV